MFVLETLHNLQNDVLPLYFIKPICIQKIEVHYSYQ